MDNWTEHQLPPLPLHHQTCMFAFERLKEFLEVHSLPTHMHAHARTCTHTHAFIWHAFIALVRAFIACMPSSRACMCVHSSRSWLSPYIPVHARPRSPHEPVHTSYSSSNFNWSIHIYISTVVSLQTERLMLLMRIIINHVTFHGL